VALGGVMGGADSEVSDTSVDLLIEAARFDPLSIRTTARKLNLHSPSSYRFERGVDPLGVDWASRRCCQLILELAGGTLATGSVDVPGPPKLDGEPIVLRLSQLRRVLGIEIEPAEVRRILTALGLGITTDDKTSLSTRPPSWRRDLTREVDLIEEVGRIHGYENVPEDVAVPMAASHRRDEDRVMGKVRTVMTAAGLDEAMTVSVVSQTWCDSVSPWSDAAPIRSSTPMLRGANLLRRSLIPSLLGARQVNQSLGNTTIELFETAKIYLPRPEQLPEEPWMLGIVSGENFLSVKGVLESVVAALNPAAEVTVDDAQVDLLEAGATCRLSLNGRLWGYLGQVGPEGLKQFGLRGAATVAEVRIDVLAAAAKLVPAHQPTSPFPAIAQDLNLIVDESLRWSDLAATVRAAAGEHLEQVDYRETYRDAQHDGAGKKRLMFSFTLRSQQRTLTGEQAEQIRTQIVAACAESHAAVLVG